MAISQNFTFDEVNYLYSGTELTVEEEVTLAIIPNPGQIFSEDFADDTGFTYDNTKVEFTGGLVRQKDQTASGSRLASNFSTINANWNKDAGLSATLNGTPTIVAGKLLCAGVQGITYPTLTKPIGAVKFKYIPSYSGSPSTNVNVISMREGSGNNNRIALTHSPSGDNFRMFINNATGAVIYTAQTIGGSNVGLVAGTEYEIELDWDNSAGTVKLFLDGVLHGQLNPGAFTFATGNAAVIVIGADTLIYDTCDASYDDVILFNTVQHTTGYTSGYTVAPYIYAASKVDGPNFSYSGVGTVLSVDDGGTTETGSPRYIVGLKYWNGSAWVTSNGTYAQANDFATALANFASFDTGGGGILPWSIVFTDSNTQSSVDEFDVEVTGEKYSSVGYVEPLQPLQVKGVIEYLQEVEVDTGVTDIKTCFYLDGSLKYFVAGTLTASNGTFAQSNTEAELSSGLASLDLGSNASLKFRWILSTSEVDETPYLLSSTVTYDFGALDVPLGTCLVYGYLKGFDNSPIPNIVVTFELDKSKDTLVEAGKNIIGPSSVSVTTNSNGYFSLTFVRSSQFTPVVSYKMSYKIGKTDIKKTSTAKLIRFTVPDAEIKDISDLIE